MLGEGDGRYVGVLGEEDPPGLYRGPRGVLELELEGLGLGRYVDPELDGLGREDDPELDGDGREEAPPPGL